jgi:cytochrome c oxidase subunit IV
MMADETPKDEGLNLNEDETLEPVAEVPVSIKPHVPAIAVEAVVTKGEETRPEPVLPSPITRDEQSEHGPAHGDTTVFRGREYPIPLYTSVFIALGILTFSEVLIAELLSNVPVVKIPLLITIATAKAVMVVMFYMHLKTDSRIFTITLAVPVGMALIATLYLLAVPQTY